MRFFAAAVAAGAAFFPVVAFAQTPDPAPVADGPQPVGNTAVNPPSSSPVDVSAANHPTPASVVAPKAQPTSSFVDVLSLRIMREKGIITEAEYQSALVELGSSIGDQAQEAPSLVIGKWSTTLYGFTETDLISDSTQSFNDAAGNAQVARPPGSGTPTDPTTSATYPGNHGRTQFSVRNSRFGFRMRAPEVSGVRASATLEMDLLGYQPSVSTDGGANGNSEASFFNNPTMRLRHAYFKVETPVVDFLVGQTWHLFGWQPVFHPNTVQIQGVVGELYSRTAQVRVSKRIVMGPTSLELAIAAMRPPQRNSFIPEGTGGIRFAVDKWTGMATQGATGKSITPASIAVTGTVRSFNVPEFSQFPSKQISLTTGAVAVDAFLPVIPAKKGHEGNSLSLTGQFVTGAGISDLFTGLTGGLAFPTIVNKTGINPAPTYPQDVDNGLVIFDNCPNPMDPNSSCNDLHPVRWTMVMGGIQYYLPGLKGRVWIAGNYSHVESPNIAEYTRPDTVSPNPNNSQYSAAYKVRQSEDWFDACLFLDPLPSVRVGLEYAHYDDKYVDGVHAINHRGQVSGFFLF